VIESEASQMMGTSLNAPLSETQQQHRHQLVHCDTAIAATKNMTQDGHLKKVQKTARSNIRKQYASGCE